MHAGTAASTPASTAMSGGAPLPAAAPITESAIIAPSITTSPWAKLISWMMPYTIV